MISILRQAEQWPLRTGIQQPPASLRLEHQPAPSGAGRVLAYDDEAREAADPSMSLTVGALSWHPGGEVRQVYVRPEYQRRGIGAAMWNHARSVNPDLHHSPTQTGEGMLWSKAVG
jgi:GNAT superfamily N-acetyltransferase